jgi:hypothetical protein
MGPTFSHYVKLFLVSKGSLLITFALQQMLAGKYGMDDFVFIFIEVVMF